MDLLDAHAKLCRAMKTLLEGQGAIARRNARKRVAAALRNIRKSMDRDYPVISKPKLVRRKKDRPTIGWVHATTNVVVSLAPLKIPVKAKNGATYVRDWVWGAYQMGGKAAVRKAKLSLKARKAYQAERALRQKDSEEIPF